MKGKSQAKMTRREMIRAAGLMVAASSALADGIRAHEAVSQPTTKDVGGAQTQSSRPSLFVSCQPPGADEDGAKKYSSGDTQAVFPLVAFWLMVTTDNWDNCLDKRGWIEDLVSEFGRENSNLADQTVKDGLTATMKQIWQELKTPEKHSALVSIRTTFRNSSSISALYGGRPCPGGGTILDIVGLKPKHRP